MTSPLVLSIHSGKQEPLAGKPGATSASRKVALPGPVFVDTLGVRGDVQVDTRHHGGRFKALCAYASEHYPACHARAGVAMPPGSFGENLHLGGLEDADVCVGDLYELGGGVRVRVAGPRAPCRTLAAHWGDKGFHLWTKEQRVTGWYMAVEVAGALSPGAALRRVERPFPAWTMPRFWDLMDRKLGEDARREFDAVKASPWLDDDWKKK